ncbi:hypothetical protein EHO59_12005 [Leptospira semungkisensis]|uniref:Arabinofuranosyltransferase n=1 Tax=Leptospira semungkisensis TaxID=2484985 RepID=A0A4R9FQM8_9LEPT|nr:hypothetical protein [Leptospira semungkisensis]TGK00665.1 hypothetical protein EHO59_12005 [Leptospira semungkisensis]
MSSKIETLLHFLRRPLPKLLFPITVLGFIYVILVNSWVCDDAYITFRTIDNFLNGYGLRWNVHERVQGYTHPLWLFGISFFSFFRIPIYYSSLILSWLCVFASAALLMRRIWQKGRPIQETYWILFLLLSSRCFVDYSTSGLENPLSFLLVLLLVQTGLELEKDFNRKSFYLFCFLLSLMYLNRQDSILFGIPFFLYLLFKYGILSESLKRTGIAFLGFLPAILWSLFSLLYYGYLFPNTAYAKLNTGISTEVLWLYGISYFQNSFRWDLFSSLLIFVAVSILPWLAWKKKPGHLSVSLGILLYLLYVCSIGGDFMAGRFIALPFVISVFLISDLFSPFLPRIALLFFVAFSLLNQNSLLYVTKDYLRIRSDEEIQDEKGAYFRSTSFLQSFYVSDFPSHGWARSGRDYRKKQADKGATTCATLNIGFYGYFAGPERRIVDVFALTDPLLSKLPTVSNWRVGHFARNIPKGYMQSVSSGENRIEDPDLKVYYTRLKLLTESADLFSKERLAEILRENLGKNRSLLSSNMTKTAWEGIPEKFYCGLGPGY